MADTLAPAALAGVQAAVALGAVVVLPLGLELLHSTRLVHVPGARSRAWPAAGALGAGALLLPAGPVAVAVAVPFAVATLVLLGAAVHAWARPRRVPVAPLSSVVAVTVALALTTVGALALVADRAAVGVLGFGGDILLLTVPHMLFAGFGACLAAGLAATAPTGGRSRLARVGASGVTLGVVAVLVGYLVSDEAELVGTVVLTGGLWCATAGAWRSARRDHRGGRRRRAAVTWSAAALGGSVVAMLLALWWAAGEVTGVVHPDLSWMVATHGALNAVAVVLGSVVALRLRTADAHDDRTTTAPTSTLTSGTPTTGRPTGGTTWTTT